MRDRLYWLYDLGRLTGTYLLGLLATVAICIVVLFIIIEVFGGGQ